MRRVALITFNTEEAPERLDSLRRAGLDAEHVDVQNLRGLTSLRAKPPDAVVIDLGRLPSHGKEIAAALRQYAATRTVPIVFIEGDPAKTDKVRSAIPEAVFTTWQNAGKVTHLAGPIAPVRRVDTVYSGTPLPKKLGIKSGSKVMAIGPPEEFEAILGPLPDNAEIVKTGKPDVLIVFARTQGELELRLPKAIGRAGDKTKLWVAWPKKTSGVRSDLSDRAVRNFGLELGWVDYKVCAIDSTWSGYSFAPKKAATVR